MSIGEPFNVQCCINLFLRLRMVQTLEFSYNNFKNYIIEMICVMFIKNNFCFLLTVLQCMEALPVKSPCCICKYVRFAKIIKEILTIYFFSKKETITFILTKKTAATLDAILDFSKRHECILLQFLIMGL